MAPPVASRANALLIAIVMFTAALAIAPIPFADAQTDADTSEPYRGEQTGPRNLVIDGQLTHTDTDDPVPDAVLTIDNDWHHAEDGEATKGYDRFETRTDPQGRYQVNVSQGRLGLQIEAAGYERLHASLEIEDNTTLNLPLRPAKTDVMTVDATIENRQGEPIDEARVSLSPTSPTRCNGDVCYTEGIAKPSVAPTETQAQTQDGQPVELRYDPHQDRYASGHTGADGQVRLQVQPGNYTVRAWHQDHLDTQQPIRGQPGETVPVTLRMVEIPPDSVTLDGIIRDADTGDPIPNAYVSVENQQWGDRDSVRTDDQGRYTLQAKPGYLLVTARAEQTYWLPCEEPQPEPLPAEPDEASNDTNTGSMDDATSSTHPEPTSFRCDGERGRDHAYLSRTGSMTPSAGENVSFDASLERAPEPDASFSGWVINASSEQGIPNATVSFHNEVANEWGQAQVDEDGSFQIDVRAGYYTIRVHAPDHFSTAINAQLDSGEEQRLTLEVPPGQPRYGGCCYAIDQPARGAEDAVDADPAMGGDGAQEGSDAQAGTSEPTGAEAYSGSGGGLGPYQAGSDESSAPGPASVWLVAVLGLGALVLRARR